MVESPKFINTVIHVQGKDETHHFPVGIDDLNPSGQLKEDALKYSDPKYRDTCSNLDLGKTLFDELLANQEIRQEWWTTKNSKGYNRRIRLKFDPKAYELYSIPWEFLKEPKDTIQGAFVVNDDRLLSYFVPPISPVVTQQTEKPLILIAAANPELPKGMRQMLPEIKISEEEKPIQDAINHNAQIELLEGRCTLTNIANKLNSNNYHIFHIIAHGVNENQLFLEDDNGNPYECSYKDFVNILTRKNQSNSLKLVFLSICKSATASKINGFESLACRLAKAGIPAVVAARGDIPFETMRPFVKVFYKELLQHYIVDLAANRARKHLLDLRHHNAFDIVLFMSLEDGQIFQKSFFKYWKTISIVTFLFIVSLWIYLLNMPVHSTLSNQPTPSPVFTLISIAPTFTVAATPSTMDMNIPTPGLSKGQTGIRIDDQVWSPSYEITVAQVNFYESDKDKTPQQGWLAIYYTNKNHSQLVLGYAHLEPNSFGTNVPIELIANNPAVKEFEAQLESNGSVQLVAYLFLDQAPYNEFKPSLGPKVDDYLVKDNARANLSDSFNVKYINRN